MGRRRKNERNMTLGFPDRTCKLGDPVGGIGRLERATVDDRRNAQEIQDDGQDRSFFMNSFSSISKGQGNLRPH